LAFFQYNVGCRIIASIKAAYDYKEYSTTDGVIEMMVEIMIMLINDYNR
jgi:hypothetical protein